MSQIISDVFVEHLVQAGVQRIYGIVGDSLHPVTDAVRGNGKLQWIHVRHEEEAAFAAEAEAQLKGYALSMTRLMLTGRADEVVDIVSSNIREIGGIR